MNRQEQDELAAEYGFSLPDDVTDEQAAYALKNYNYLKYLLKGVKRNETLRNHKGA